MQVWSNPNKRFNIHKNKMLKKIQTNINKNEIIVCEIADVVATAAAAAVTGGQ